jgi:hypothetical protein
MPQKREELKGGKRGFSRVDRRGTRRYFDAGRLFIVALAVEFEDDNEDEYDFAREIHLWNRSIPLTAARRFAVQSLKIVHFLEDSSR